MFEAIKTFFLFSLSTYAPANEPNIIAGMINDNTTPDTAVLDRVFANAMIIKKKLNTLTATWVKSSLTHK